MSPASKRWLLVAVVVLVSGLAVYGGFDMTERHPGAIQQVERATLVAVAPPVASEPVLHEAIRQEASDPTALPTERTTTLERLAPSPIPAPAPPQMPLNAAQPVDPGLPAEGPMMTAHGPNVRELGRLMKDGDYDEFLDRLTAQAAADPLAIELTELYSSSAAGATQQVPDVEVRRLACGRVLCAGVIKAASKDAFASWVVRFQTNPAAPPHAMGIHAKANADGTLDYRFTFSNDPNRRAAVHPGGNPVRIGN